MLCTNQKWHALAEYMRKECENEKTKFEFALSSTVFTIFDAGIRGVDHGPKYIYFNRGVFLSDLGFSFQLVVILSKYFISIFNASRSCKRHEHRQVILCRHTICLCSGGSIFIHCTHSSWPTWLANQICHSPNVFQKAIFLLFHIDQWQNI